MAVRVEEVTPTKSGKALRVKLGTQWYGAFKDCGLEKGMVIEPDIVTDEKFGPQIRKWKPAPDAGTVAPREPGEDRTVGTGDNIAPWYMPFVSNTVAHAIQAGLIKTPIEINQWALKAAQIAVATKTEAGT